MWRESHRTELVASIMADVAKRIEAVPGVEHARPWTRVEGQERIYIDFSSFNRKSGTVGCELILTPKSLYTYDLSVGEWSGAATREWHRDHNTIDIIREVCDSWIEEHRDPWEREDEQETEAMIQAGLDAPDSVLEAARNANP